MEKNIYNPEFVKGLFNKMSASYELMNFITSFGFSIRWRKQFLEPLIQTNQKVQVIDLLTGMGETWHALKNKFPNSNLTVLDFSERMLINAKLKNQKKFNNEIILIQENILENKLPGNHYDIVTCAFGLKTFNEEQLQILATETERILKTSGEFSFVEVSKPPNLILKELYGFYLGKIIPILGQFFLGNPSDYKMLWKYTNDFVNSKRATEIFKASGLTVEYKSYFYGCATGFYGVKNA